MKPKYLVYVDGVLIDDSESYMYRIGQGLIDSNSRPKDIITIHPFNHFDDENTDHKAEAKPFHNKDLQILSISRQFTTTFNSMVKTVITISLKAYTNSGDA